MTSSRFAVVALNPMGELEPGTLTLDTDSGRGETLKAEILSTRGRGGLLFQGEVWAERLDPNLPIYAGRCPPGYQLVKFELDAPDSVGPRSVYAIYTVVASEILQSAKVMRRGKPRVPVSRFSKDEIYTCCGCGQQAMARGSDNVGWKGIQMFPDKGTYDYYCNKPACIEVRDHAIDVAKINWGMADTSPPPVTENEGP